MDTSRERRQLATDVFRMTARIRAIELALQDHIAKHGFGGFWHPGLGQEGLQAGAVAALRKDDYLLYAHRGVGYVIAKGMELEEILGDLFGRTLGSTGGKGAGTPHFADLAVGVLGGAGTLGSNFTIGAGAALTSQLRGTDQVTAVFFGDGAAGRGPFHEAALQASVWKLPVVWVCENNGWALSAPFHEQSPTEDIADRAVAYGMPGVVVNGQDPLEVHSAVEDAVARARRGEGPSLIEAKTVRIRGHYEGDQQKYRDFEESDFEDPLDVLRPEVGEAEADTIYEEETKRVAKVLEAVLEAATPTRETVFRDVWA